MEKEPQNYIYGINSKPPAAVLVALALEHFVKFSFLIVCIQLITSVAGAPASIGAQVISISLIAGAIATILMAMRSGCFIPAQASVPYFITLIAAAKLGGLPLVFGASIIAGLLQCFFTPVFTFFEKIFDHTTVGFIVLMLGVWAALLGVSELFHPGNLGQLALHASFANTSIQNQGALLGFATLLIMILMRLGKRTRLYCILVAMLFAWGLAFILGEILPDRLQAVKEAAWFALPHFTLPHYHFSWALCVPIIIVAFLASAEVFALIATIYQMQDKTFAETLPYFQRGNVAAGIGVVISGLLGGVAQSPIPGSIGDLIMTGAYSRYIAYLYAPALILMAFCPKLAMLTLTIPAAVNGAAIVFMGGVIMMTGFKLIRVNSLKAYHFQALSFAFLIGLATDMLPGDYLIDMHLLPWVTNSALAVGLLAYLILRYLFSLGQNQ